MDSKYEALDSVPQNPLLRSYSSFSTLRNSEELDDKDIETIQDELSQRRCKTTEAFNGILRSRWLWLMHAILITSSLTIFALAVTVRSSTLKHVREFSAWSPADRSVEYNAVKYNVSTTQENRFVGAGPEVDKAWREISYDMGDQWIPKQSLGRLGMPETSLQVDHPQTGESGYRVGVEVFHQLHCINLLRRVTYKEYYEPLGGEFAAGPEHLQKHTDHCLEILRLNTQCNADIGLFTFYMVEGDPLAWPELNTKHVCRNFEGVRQWALDNSVGNMEVLV